MKSVILGVALLTTVMTQESYGETAQRGGYPDGHHRYFEGLEVPKGELDEAQIRLGRKQDDGSTIYDEQDREVETVEEDQSSEPEFVIKSEE